MGCDIHAHVEIKVNDVWEHYSIPDVDRNYKLFAKLAGVRNYEKIKPIVEPRGLPVDVSVVTKIDSDQWDGDGHNHSYITSKEAADLDNHTFGWLFGNTFCRFEDSREDYPEKVKDARVVFWFDN